MHIKVALLIPATGNPCHMYFWKMRGMRKERNLLENSLACGGKNMQSSKLYSFRIVKPGIFVMREVYRDISLGSSPGLLDVFSDV